MKVFRIILFVCLTTGLLFTAVSGARQRQMSVQVKKGQVRSRPTFLGKIVGTLSYGDRVNLVEEKKTWFRIAMPGAGISGWMHASSLTRKKIVLTAGAADVREAATSDELALAGKGFNKQVEGEFRAKNRHIDFTWIDQMEQYAVSKSQINRFIQYGGLTPTGGDQ